MKYSEKMGLLTKGVSWAEIKELEKQEADEAEAAASEAKAAEEAKKTEEAKKAAESKSALEAAQDMVKELESKLSAKEDELAKLNKQFTELNNKRTVVDKPEAKDSAADVMKQLFHPKKQVFYIHYIIPQFLMINKSFFALLLLFLAFLAA